MLIIFHKTTTELFIEVISELKKKGAECVILGYTEISLVINTDNSPFSILDSTRLLSKYAVKLAVIDDEMPDNECIK